MGQQTRELVIKALADLRENPLNYRKHGGKQRDLLAKSLRKHGQQRPIIIQQDGTILAGHGIVKAALHLGWESIECLVYSGDHPDEYLAMDNRGYDLGETDDERLIDLLRSVSDTSATGYTPAEITALEEALNGDGFDAVDETHSETAADMGLRPDVHQDDCWTLGMHRIVCSEADPSLALDIPITLVAERTTLLGLNPWLSRPTRPDVVVVGHLPCEWLSEALGVITAPTTLIVAPALGAWVILPCEEIGRACLAFDDDPDRVAEAIVHWEAVTGLQAIRQGDLK